MAQAVDKFFSGLGNAIEGVVLDGAMFLAELRLTIGDEGATKITLDVRGSGAVLPCSICTNVTMFESELDQFDDDIVTIAEFDPCKHKWHTDRSFRQAVEYVNTEYPTLNTIADATMLQKCMGINFCPRGMVATLPYFRPISSQMFDWAHIWVVHGIFQKEVGHMLTMKLFTIDEAHDYLQKFSWPRKNAVNGQDVFAKRSDKATSLQCDASQCLGLYPVLLTFLSLMSGQNPTMDKVILCFSLLCQSLDLLRLATMGFPVDCRKMLSVIIRHLRLHKELYEHVIPKMHMAVHLPFMCRSFGGLISCMVHERKHRLVKRIANDMKNTTGRNTTFAYFVCLCVLKLLVRKIIVNLLLQTCFNAHCAYNPSFWARNTSSN